MHVLEAYWKSEDSLWDSVLYFYHVGTGDQTQAIRLGSKVPLPTEPYAGPMIHIHSQWLYKAISGCHMAQE